MLKTHRRTYPWTFNAVKKLAKLGVLSIETKGHSSICRINLDSRLAISYLSLLEQMDWSRKKPAVPGLLEDVPNHFCSILVSSESMIMIADDSADTKTLFRSVRPKVLGQRLLVLRKSEFLSLLLSRENNQAKSAFRDRMIACGAESYYLMIKEAIEHGFKG